MIPIPPAAFSPLTTTKSSASSSRSPGSSSRERAAAGAADDVADEEDRGHARHAIGRPHGRILAAMRRAEADARSSSTRRSRTRPDPARAAGAGAAGHVAPVRGPALGPARRCSRWRIARRLSALARAAGPVLLLFIVAGLIALLLNPFVTLLRRARFPRGRGGADRLPGCWSLAVVGIGVLLANPIADQVSAFRDDVPGDRRRRQRRRSPTSRPGSTTTASTSRSPKQGQTALQTLGDRVAEGSGELVTFTRDALHDARRGRRSR